MTTPTIASGTGAWTPGPWVVASSEAAGRGISYYVGSTAMHNRSQIAHVRVLYDDPHNAERNANSRLIAAAPELVQAGDELADKLWILRCESCDKKSREAAEAALAMWNAAKAKAEGRNP